MDMFLYIPNKNFKTYIYDHSPNGRTWGIRYPGATRGSIIVDENNIIIDIILSNIPQLGSIYKDEVKECFKKYIGMKLVMKY
jgi:hypothetical protein